MLGTKELAEIMYQQVQAGMKRQDVASLHNLHPHNISVIFRRFGLPVAPKGFQKGNQFGERFQKGEWVTIHCQFCNKEMVVPIHKIKNGKKYCSSSCRSQYNKRVGPDHWNWKGGISDRWTVLHNSQEYKDWRMAVYRRDHFRCQKCGTGNSRQNKLNAHHIKLKAQYPELILDVGNGQTLCRKCHDGIHYPNLIKVS